MTAPAPLHRRDLGRRPYEPVWHAMRRFTDERNEATADELWSLEHDAVYTLGQAGRREHVLSLDDTPLIETDRGGQVTWHGPGQAVVYPLLDLRRYGLGARSLVTLLEQSVVTVLAGEGIEGRPRCDAPGVYVDDTKVAAVGLRIRRGCCYHGVALNVDNDLAPFTRINPCGYAGLQTNSLRSLGSSLSLAAAQQRLADTIHHALQRRYESASNR